MATLTVARIETAKYHDKRVLRFEARESLKAAEAAAKNDSKAQAWLKKNRHLWR